MEIYEKTVEVLEPEVTKLMKFMYFQVSRVGGGGGGGGSTEEGSQKPYCPHTRFWCHVIFFHPANIFKSHLQSRG